MERVSGDRTNPFRALNGLGCTDCSTQCFCRLTPATRFAAGVPQARNTTPCVRTRATVSMTRCVKRSQPRFEWLLASCARTVRHALSISTPRSAQGVSSPPRFDGGSNRG